MKSLITHGDLALPGTGIETQVAPMSQFVLLPQHTPRHQSFPSALKEISTALSLQPRNQGTLVFHSAKPPGGIDATRSQKLDFPLAAPLSWGLAAGCTKGAALEGRWRSLHREGTGAVHRQTPAPPAASSPGTAATPGAKPQQSLSHRGCLFPRSLHKPFYPTHQTALNYLSPTFTK